jgi:hypothetical protein
MAHPYATDSREREIVPLYLAIAAILSAIGFSKILSWTHLHPPSPWIDAPSTATFYALYFWFFRKWLWKINAFHSLGWIKVPDLAGEWEGEVITSFDEKAGRHAVGVSIVQDWTHLKVNLKSAYSQSTSLIAAILIDDNASLTYEYFNEPLPEAAETMHAHKGTARLTLSNDGSLLDGDYYSGRDRSNFGALHLHRK